MSLKNNTLNIAIIQSCLFGDSKGTLFNDIETVIGYPKTVTVDSAKPLQTIQIAYGHVIDGITLTYVESDGDTIDVSHGTSTSNNSDTNLKKATITIGTNENIVAISGKHGSSHFGIRVVALSFTIYDSSTGIMRTEGPYGGTTGTAFRVTANGIFLAVGGYGVNTNSSVGELKKKGKDGGLYGLTFADVAYRSV